MWRKGGTYLKVKAQMRNVSLRLSYSHTCQNMNVWFPVLLAQDLLWWQEWQHMAAVKVFVTSKRFFVGWWQCSSYGWMFLRPSRACRAALHPDLSLWDIRSHHCPVSPKLGASWNQTQVHWFLGGLWTLVDSSKPFRKPPSSCFPLILPWPITVLDIFLHACLYAYCFWRESSDAQSQALL